MFSICMASAIEVIFCQTPFFNFVKCLSILLGTYYILKKKKTELISLLDNNQTLKTYIPYIQVHSFSNKTLNNLNSKMYVKQ